VFITAAGVVPAAAVGTLLAARRPGNPIGWLLLTIIIVEVSPAGPYLILDYRMHHGTLPLGAVAVVIEECWPMFLVSVTLLLWLFPDGRLPAGRWHRAAVAGAVGWLLVGLATSSRGVLVAAGHHVRVQAGGGLANPVPGPERALDVVVIAGTAGSTGRATTPRPSWPRSPRDCAGPSIWTRCGATWPTSSVRRSSPATCRCGFPAPGRTPRSRLLPLPASYARRPGSPL
jgi:hypothetical protein